MRRALAIALVLVAPLAGLAFAQEDDGPGFFGRIFGGGGEEEEGDGAGFLEGLIESNLSGAGREVDVVGFEGALSSRATLQELTIADEDGVWLTLRDVVLDWNRSALLRGRVDITELSAGEILLPRLPAPSEPTMADVPSPEAQGFSLPELPVAIEIDRIDAERVELGEPLFGAEAVVTLEGSLMLAGGAGSADILAERIDDEQGTFSLDASYDNETSELALALEVSEGPDGIVANLIDLPGRPSLELTAAGEGPLTDLTVELALATDGQQRLAGQVELTEADGGGLRFDAAFGGDVAPVFLPEYRDFFGDDVQLAVQGATQPAGGVVIDTLRLVAEALRLEGAVTVGADGLPDLVNLEGAISSSDGETVLLPLSGGPTRVASVTLDVDFDASESEDWRLEAVIDDLSREGFAAERIALDGTGQIATTTAADGTARRAVTAQLVFAADALDLADGGAQEALGQRVTGELDLAWSDGAPLTINTLTVDGESYGLAAEGQVDFGEGVLVSGEATVSARDLSAFSGLANRPLDGAIELTASGEGAVLEGSFALALDGETQSLEIGDPRIDPLLAGDGTLTLRTDRSETGTRIETFRIETDQLLATGGGNLSTGNSRLALNARVAETSVVSPDLSGPALVDLSASETELGWTFDVEATGSGAEISAEGTVENLDAEPVVAATLSANIADLAPFSDLARRPLAGRVEAAGDVRTTFDLLNASVDLTAEGANIAIGDPRIDPLLDGALSIAVEAERNGDVVQIANLRVDGPQFAATAEGRIDDLTVQPVFDGRATVAAQDLSRFSGLAGRDLAGSIDAEAAGALAFDLSRFDLTLDAEATDLDPGVPGAADALAGRTVLGATASRDGDVVTIERLSIENPQLDASGAGEVSDLTGAPAFDGQIDLTAPDLSPFSGLARRDLDGRLEAAFDGAVAADLRVVDASLRASGRDLDFGLPGSGSLLPGETALAVTALREGDVVNISELSLENANLAASGDARITDLNATPVVDGALTLRADNIAPFGAIAGRSLGGAVTAEAEGQAALDLATFDIDAMVRARNLRVGQTDADRLLTGASTLRVEATRADGVIRIDTAVLDTSGFDLTASGALGAENGGIDLNARLADIGPYAPGFSGPVTVDGNIADRGEALALDLDAAGPGGISLAVDGTVDLADLILDLEVNGSAPLAAANRFVEPRTLAGTVNFDLDVQGPPGLDAVSGAITSDDARLVAPTLGIIIDRIDLAANIASGRLTIDADAGLQSGGGFAVNGGLGLSGGIPADLTITLQRAVLVDPELYTTVVNGQIDITGPLTGGGRVAGTIALGETELRIPSTGLGAGGPIPEVTHINEPPAVRATRERAGLLRNGGNGGQTAAERRQSALGLDLRIVAENRIFIRGRGLDAELGGALRLRGTTAEIAPAGQFELIRGRLDILGQRLTLDDGSVTLQGDFSPRIRLVAETQTDGVTVFVVVEGQASEPDISFLSSPDLPEDEVLARLLFGRSVEDISPLQAAQLASAVAQLAGRGPGIGDTLRQNFGLDDLDLTTSDNGGTAVRAGKYLTENLYTDIVVDSEGETQLNLNFDLSDSVTVKGGVDSQGGTGLGVFFERDY